MNDGCRSCGDKPTQLGLGDVIARITTALGITPCAGCKRRQQWLNRHVPLQRDVWSAPTPTVVLRRW